MSEAIDKVTVFQDAADTWWLEFYSDGIRHQVTIEDVRDGLASFVNMLVTNAVLHEKVNDAAALTDLLANVQECRKLGDFMLRKQINTALELYEETMKGG